MTNNKQARRSSIAVVGNARLPDGDRRLVLAFEVGRGLIDAGYRLVTGGTGGRVGRGVIGGTGVRVGRGVRLACGVIGGLGVRLGRTIVVGAVVAMGVGVGGMTWVGVAVSVRPGWLVAVDGAAGASGW